MQPAHDPDGIVEQISAKIGGLHDPRRAIPRAAKDPDTVALIETAVRALRTHHVVHRADARLFAPPSESVQLVVTSPPYWTLKKYRDSPGQMGHIADYDQFLDELDTVWSNSFHALVPGGRLVCVVGDVCLSRREAGRHHVMPLHASIQERCRRIGFDNLAPIFWHKISNVRHEVERPGSGFLGKPYEPNAVIKHDVEYVLMLRKPGGYRSPSLETKLLSLIPEPLHRRWFQQIWNDIPGTSTRLHPAPYPLELAERLVRMFSFVGDVVMDPFTGTGTTNVAAALWGRNSLGIEVDDEYLTAAVERLRARIEKLGAPAVVTEDRSEAVRPLPMPVAGDPRGELHGVPAA